MGWNISLPPAEWYTRDNPLIEGVIKAVEAAPVVALDTETTGLDIAKDIPLFWSLAFDNRRMCMPADTMPFFKKALLDKRKQWVFHNAKYDVHMLANVGIDVGGEMLDTKVMHALLYDSDPHKLKYMAKQLLGWTWKDFVDTFGRLRRGESYGDVLLKMEQDNRGVLVEYASNDAWGTLELYRLLKAELERTNTFSLYPETFATMADVYFKTEVPFTRVLWQCERNGARIDMEHLSSKREPAEKELARISREITKIVGKVINPKSPDQLRDYFFNVVGLKPLTFTKGGKSGNKQAQVDEAFLKHYAGENTVCDLLLEHRGLTKLLDTYICGLTDCVDPFNRIHTSFNQDVARTGRLSSSDPNLQNIPRPDNDTFQIRKAFTPEPGNTMIVADYEQLEMRLLACAAMEQDMIDIFLKGWDIHMGNASLVFDIPYDDIKKAKKVDKQVKDGTLPESAMTPDVVACLDARQAAKAIGFGLNYGMKENKLARAINKTPEEAKGLIEQYMDRYPAVAHFYKQAIDETRKSGYAFSLLGRRRYLPMILSSSQMDCWGAERQAVNMQIQGTAADAARLAMIKVHNANLVDKYDCHMLMQVHDELVFECADENVDKAMAEIKQLMEHPFPTDLSVPLEVAIGKGPNWKDAK